MKRTIICTLLVFVCASVFAQKKQKKDEYGLVPTFPVTIDADLAEWRDKLTPMDQDSSWSFAISNDADFIYAAIKVKNEMLQYEAVRNGFIININKDGKKKDGAALIFPIPDSESRRAMRQDDNFGNMNVREELIKRSRGYGVKGFQRIVDGLLSFQNTYGVQAIAKLTAENELIYEAKIPIDAIGLKDPKQTVAIQVQLNNQYAILQKALRNRPQQNRGIYGAPSAPTVRIPYSVKTEVWIVGPLNEI
ncbi:hypothetical protein [Sphingobacterium sp. UBA6645]|uniref:hypothetical protein n=1 Tax=Sphingobacterium sp. UBA6645 TaxID=1947511 RepID=UPI0025FD9498|nr:hypothetical protein [Sphingobacterium sp. UBA6645]